MELAATRLRSLPQACLPLRPRAARASQVPRALGCAPTSAGSSSLRRKGCAGHPDAQNAAPGGLPHADPLRGRDAAKPSGVGTEGGPCVGSGGTSRSGVAPLGCTSCRTWCARLDSASSRPREHLSCRVLSGPRGPPSVVSARPAGGLSAGAMGRELQSWGCAREGSGSAGRSPAPTVVTTKGGPEGPRTLCPPAVPQRHPTGGVWSWTVTTVFVIVSG